MSPLLPLPFAVLLVGLALAVLVLLRRWAGTDPARAGRMRDAGAVTLLLALVAGFFWRPLFTSDVWLPIGGGDLASFFYPLYSFIYHSIQAGQFPLWNPDSFGGMPLAADVQSGLFYPPNLLAWYLLPSYDYGTLEWLLILHYAWAILGMYCWLRDLRLLRPAAVAGATAFAFCGFMTAHFGHMPMIFTAAWLPWNLLLARRAATRANPAWVALAGIALGLTFLAGHPQTTLYEGLALALYWLFLIWNWELGIWNAGARFPAGVALLRDPRVARLLRLLGRLALTVGIAAGLGAVQLLPAQELAGQSVRAAVTYEEASQFAMQPVGLLTLLLPRVFGANPQSYWVPWQSTETWGYLGVVVLFLAVAGLFLRRDRRQGFLVALALFALLMMLGPFSVVFSWIQGLLPGLDRFRAAGRFLLLLGAATAGLAALGLDALWRLLPLVARDEDPGSRVQGPGFGGAAAVGQSAALDGGVGQSAALDSGVGQSAALDGGVGQSAALDRQEPPAASVGQSAALDGGVGQSAALDSGVGQSAALDGGVGQSAALDRQEPPAASVGQSSALDGLASVIDPVPVAQTATVAGIDPPTAYPREATASLPAQQAPRTLGAPVDGEAAPSPAQVQRVRWLGIGVGALAVFIGLGLVPVVGAIFLAGFSIERAQIVLNDLVMLAVWLALVAGVLGAAIRGRMGGRAAVLALAVLLVIDLFSPNSHFNPTSDNILQGYQQPAALDFLHAGTGPPAYYRIDSDTDVAPVWQPLLGTLAGIPDAGGLYNPLELRRYAAYWDLAKAQRNTVLYDLLSIKYTLALSPSLIADPKFTRVASGAGGLLIAANQHADPRLFLVHDAQVEPDDTAALGKLLNGTVLGWHTIYLADGTATPSTTPSTLESGNPGEQAQITCYTPNEIEARVTAREPGWAVFSETWYPGWEALIDGNPQPVPIARADTIFRAVRVPAGTHTILLRFNPSRLIAGLQLSLGTLFLTLVVGLAAWAAWRRGNKV